MKLKNNFVSKIITGVHFIISLILQCQSAPSSSQEVVFYEDAQYQGDRLFLKLGTGCYTMDVGWSNKISSVNPRGYCIVAFDKANCRGRAIKLTSDSSSTSDLRRVRFDNKLSSLSICSRSNGGIPSDSNMKGAPDIWRVGLEEHNRYRRRHGVPPLKVERQLCKDAKLHADYLAKNNRFEVSTFQNYGENLATSYENEKVDAVRDVIARWYSKIEYFDFNYPEGNKYRPKSGQFSSIVWKATSHMGIGISKNNEEGKWIVVVFYDPPATTSRYRENVHPVIREVALEKPTMLETSSLDNLDAYF